MVVKIDKIKIPKKIYRHIEQDFYSYGQSKNLKKIKNSTLDHFPLPPCAIEPTAKQTWQSWTNTQTKRKLQSENKLLNNEITQTIETILPKAGSDLQAIFYLQYCRHFSWQKVAMQLHLEQATYYRRRRELIYLYGRELGLLSEKESITNEDITNP